jgi:hypothetical protein
VATTYLLDDMEVFLSGAGLGLTFASNLFASMMPDEPDSVTVMYEYSGYAPEYTMGPNSLPAIAQPHLQIVTRDVSYTSSRADCEAAARSLESICNQTVNTTYYERVARLQDPFFMKRDAVRNRVYFCCNFEVMRTPT